MKEYEFTGKTVEEAVEEGLIDELGGLAQAVGKLTELIEARIPAQKKGE